MAHEANIKLALELSDVEATALAIRPLFFEFTRFIGEAKAMGPNRRNGWSVARWTRVCTTSKISLHRASIRERLVADNPALFLRISSN